MALLHATSGDLIPALPLGPDLRHTPTHALVKGAHLEVIRVVLPTGKLMPSHQVAGEITLLCIEGVMELRTERGSQLLRQGDLVYLAGGESHALQGLDDASAIVTISLPTTSLHLA